MNTSASTFCPHCGALNPPTEATCFACGRALDATTPGEPSGLPLLRQRYRLRRQIGAGGFGAVYQAEDQQLGNRLVAVKEMSARGLTPEEMQEATDGFRREALLLAHLSHPNLPRIHEQFEENGRWYLVMDFIAGQTLEDYLTARGDSLPVKEALQLGLQLTSVLGYLHTRQPPIVFRDLKPSNVMLTPEGQVYLIDFGIARLFKPGQTKDTIAFGSPGYAAPEQYGKTQTSPRSDVFSLGALLHQLLTGIDPSDTPFRFKALTMPRPAGLSGLIVRMVDLDAEKRPPSMDLIRRDLEAMLADPRPWRADDLTEVLPGAYSSPARTTSFGAAYQTAAPASWQGQAVVQSTQGPPALQPSPRKRRPGRWIGLGVVTVMLAACLTSFFSSHHGVDVAPNVASASPVINASPTSAVKTGVPVGIPVYAMAWSPDGATVAYGGADGVVELWSVATGRQIPVKTDLLEVNALAWSPDSQYVVVAGEAGKFQLLYVYGDVYASFHIPTSNISAVSWSANSSFLALAGSDGIVYIYNITDQDYSDTFHVDDKLLTTVAWSPNGDSIAFGGYDQTVQVWDFAAHKQLYVYHDPEGVIEYVTWSPDGKSIASTDAGGRIQTWDALTGYDLYSYPTSDRPVNAVAWSHNQKYLAAATDNFNVAIWDVNTTVAIQTFTQQASVISAIAWSTGDDLVASASYDGTVQIWNPSNGLTDETLQQP